MGGQGAPAIWILFVIGWIAFVIFGAIYHLRNALGDDVPGGTVIEFDDATNPGGGTDIVERMRQLEQLRTENLVSETEYQAKRLEILRRM